MQEIIIEYIKSMGYLAIGLVPIAFLRKKSIRLLAILFLSGLTGGHIFLMEFIKTLDLKVAWQVWKVGSDLKGYLCIGVLLWIVSVGLHLTKNKDAEKFYNLVYWFYSYEKQLIPLSAVITVFRLVQPPCLYAPNFFVIYLSITYFILLLFRFLGFSQPSADKSF